MSNKTITKASLAVKAVLARIQGDDTEALALNIVRKNMSSLDLQISTLKSKIVEAEIDIETKQEALHNAIYPTELESNSKLYCDIIAKAQKEVKLANKHLADLQTSIKYFETILEEKF